MLGQLKILVLGGLVFVEYLLNTIYELFLKQELKNKNSISTRGWVGVRPKLFFSNELFSQLIHENEFAVFTNHGSYGALPREVMEKRVQLLHTAEAHPDRCQF